ncbi:MULTISPECIES: helix-turn-helix domain-containing protein [Actinobacillus]|uniref:helix-turn-helix domain-containing protein n=1 Tax=Actinobacillus TaxID=713 RepID=UPI0024425682|nr:MULTISPECIES: helix-turn-helix domain-containing protein [Actinobacillus]WGE32610.1 helix-turn-helix domain-containing protein [Actinobacillus genomosp. 2]WGE90123.1 helix-turn-helix domain-containing protein [Actinobacillus arthritidis]
MKIKTDKERFSERLKFALSVAYPKGLKTSQIAIKFNLQYAEQPITQQAVHKWLNGLAIPSQDKIETLANWLNVKPEWLRYGVADEQEFQSTDEILSRLIQGLSEQQKTVLINLITSFK